MQTPNSIELGLKTLTVCPQNDHKHHNSCIMTSNLLSPPSSPASFAHVGDYIGMESCLDLKNCEDAHMMMGGIGGGGGESKAATTHVVHQSYRSKRDQRWAMKKKEFPPPISLLARTENLPSHMPFVLKRYYTNDGRLILREEKVRHHEYFRAHRSNGHLTLQLVPLDDDDLFPSLADENKKDERDEQHYNAEQEEEAAAADSDADADTEADIEANIEEEMLHKDIEGLIADAPVEKDRTVGIGSNGGSGGCLNYNSVIISSSCFLGLQVPAINPVHT